MRGRGAGRRGRCPGTAPSSIPSSQPPMHQAHPHPSNRPTQASAPWRWGRSRSRGTSRACRQQCQSRACAGSPAAGAASWCRGTAAERVQREQDAVGVGQGSSKRRCVCPGQLLNDSGGGRHRVQPPASWTHVRAGDDAGAPAAVALGDEEGVVNVLQLVDHDGKRGQLRTSGRPNAWDARRPCMRRRPGNRTRLSPQRMLWMQQLEQTEAGSGAVLQMH